MATHPNIRKNLVDLVNSFDVGQTLTMMVSDGLLTGEEHAKLSLPNRTKADKASDFLMNILPRKGSKDMVYERFAKILVWSGQLDLAKKIHVTDEAIEEYKRINPYQSACTQPALLQNSQPHSCQGWLIDTSLGYVVSRTNFIEGVVSVRLTMTKYTVCVYP